jgi:hypothetical protein
MDMVPRLRIVPTSPVGAAPRARHPDWNMPLRRSLKKARDGRLL